MCSYFGLENSTTLNSLQEDCTLFCWVSYEMPYLKHPVIYDSQLMSLWRVLSAKLKLSSHVQIQLLWPWSQGHYNGTCLRISHGKCLDHRYHENSNPQEGRCVSDFRGRLFSFPTSASSPQDWSPAVYKGASLKACLLLTPKSNLIGAQCHQDSVGAPGGTWDEGSLVFLQFCFHIVFGLREWIPFLTAQPYIYEH